MIKRGRERGRGGIGHDSERYRGFQFTCAWRPGGTLCLQREAAGQYVVVEARFEGTNDGNLPMMKLKKTGRKVSVPFLEIDRFANGRIAEAWLLYDSGAFGVQLTGPAPK